MSKVILLPLYYVRGSEVTINFYATDAHPNDKKSKAVKGASRGRMMGLEESGWTPCETWEDMMELVAKNTPSNDLNILDLYKNVDLHSDVLEPIKESISKLTDEQLLILSEWLTNRLDSKAMGIIK